jgi:hypothetical protein
MPRVCTVCAHPDRGEIEMAIVAGAANRRIAAQFDLSESAIRRHRAVHLPALLALSTEELTTQRESVRAGARLLYSKALTLLTRAEQDPDVRAMAAALREARGCLELLAKLVGELDERPQVNILVAPEWLTVRSTLLAALSPYVEARVAVAAALQELEREAS